MNKRYIAGLLMLLLAGIRTGQAYGMHGIKRVRPTARRVQKHFTVQCPARTFTKKQRAMVEEYVLTTRKLKRDPNIEAYELLRSYVQEKYQKRWFWQKSLSNKEKELAQIEDIQNRHIKMNRNPLIERLWDLEEDGHKENLFRHPTTINELYKDLSRHNHGSSNIPTTNFYDILEKDQWLKDKWKECQR